MAPDIAAHQEKNDMPDSIHAHIQYADTTQDNISYSFITCDQNLLHVLYTT